MLFIKTLRRSVSDVDINLSALEASGPTPLQYFFQYLADNAFPPKIPNRRNTINNPSTFNRFWYTI